jgi:hypothetical protein
MDASGYDISTGAADGITDVAAAQQVGPANDE